MTRRKLLSLTIAGTMIVAMDCHQVIAQEAGTAPTCTGCSGSKTKGTRPPKPSHPAKNSAVSSGGRSANFDGTWAGMSTGDCIPNYRWTMYVANGVISGSNASGNVARGGSVRASMIVNGYKYDVVGRASLSSASGTWKTTGNCAGKWTATKS